MSKPRPSRAVLPASVAVLPLAVEAVRTATGRAKIWFWGDQALIDIEARDSLLGRNLLGVYDRYGWHHLGPLWLLLLGVARWLGGGTTTSLVLGSYAVQAIAAVSIVVVANRLLPGLMAWWAALLVLGYEWCFGLERLGTVWAPYAVALPAALLVLLVADAVSNDDPWPSTVGAVACASFLCQTEISTALVAAAVVLTAPLLRLAVHAPRWAEVRGGKAKADGAGAGRSMPKGWGWSRGHWLLGGAGLVAVLVVAWLPPIIQQLSSSPGNLVQIFDFFTTHQTHHAWQQALKVGNTIFGSFPFAIGVRGGGRDADPGWISADPVWRTPWYVAYIGACLVAAIVARARRERPAFALAAVSVIALLAAGLSIPAVYGPIYPYLVYWMGALVVPAWLALLMVAAPILASASGWVAGAVARARKMQAQWALSPAAVAGLVVSVAVTTAFVLSPVPMTGKPSVLGRRSWQAVAAAVSAPGVKTVYIDIAGSNGMPEAAAIADQAVRHGRRVEFDPKSLYFLDPSFAPDVPPQVEVVICCGKGDPDVPPYGVVWKARVGGQEIYSSVSGFVPQEKRGSFAAVRRT